jgi:hypothetical protein
MQNKIITNVSGFKPKYPTNNDDKYETQDEIKIQEMPVIIQL